MKILFMMDRRVNAGSIQGVANYVRIAHEFDYTIALYGRPDPRFPNIRFSSDVEQFDYVVFIVESGLLFMSGLRMPRVLADVPRHRRAVLDADGMYNERITVDGYDRNHTTESEKKQWLTYLNLLSDRIFQPTYHPQLPGVMGVPFYGYDPRSHISATLSPDKRFDILHVAHNWWRWRDVSSRLLPALHQIRPRLDGVCFVGSWWDAPPAVVDPNLKLAFQVEAESFPQFRIQIRPPVPFTDVIRTMSEGRINIMTQRPLFRCLRLLTSKYFEIFCADTIPLLMIDPDLAESVYGPAGRELALHECIAEKLLDAIERPRRYREIVEAVRCHLTRHHSYHNRLQELAAALTAQP